MKTSRLVGFLCVGLGLWCLGHGLIGGVIRRDIVVHTRAYGDREHYGEDAAIWGWIEAVSGAAFVAFGIYKIRSI